MALTREALLAGKRPPKFEVVPAPEWGDDVYVWVLSAAESEAMKGGDDDRITVGMIAAAAIGDEAGPFNPPLTHDEAKGLFGLGTMSRIVDVAARLNVLTVQSAEDVRGN